MGYPTPIAWCDATYNPIAGCSIHSPGCTHCYAQTLSGTRLHKHPLYAGTTDYSKAGPVFNGHLTQAPANSPIWDWPRRWRGAKNPVMGEGMPSLIFVGDMSDLFHKDRAGATIDRVVQSVVCSEHIGQLLTKRADVMLDYFAAWREYGDRRKLWLGFSAEDQSRFDERWGGYMRRLADEGWTVFVSIEPQLGLITLPEVFLSYGAQVWVIIGGESGSKARKWNWRWGGSLVQQCARAGVPCFVKQYGSKPVGGMGNDIPLKSRSGSDPSEWPESMQVRQFPTSRAA